MFSHTTIYVSSEMHTTICVLVLPFHRITRIEKVHVRSRHNLRNAKDLLQTLQRHLLLLVRNAGGRADRQHTSAYVSIRPHAAYVSIRQHTPAYLAAARIFWSSTVSSMCTRVAVLYTCVYQHIPTLTIHPPTHQPIHILNILSYHSIRPHMSAYVSIRQHTLV